MFLRTVFIINPKSGTPKFVKALHYLIPKLFGNGNGDIVVHESLYPGNVQEIARDSANAGCEMVVAVGGDGTVNQTAHALLHTETALGVIPTGSGNGYASNMGLPRRIDSALKVIKNPGFKQIDVGSVGDNIFLNSCGIGWEAVIATMFEGSKLRGPLPYAAVTISTYLQYEPQEIEIEAEPGGWTYFGRPMLFSVANMREYGLGMTIAPNAIHDDGMLDISLIPRHSLLIDVKHTSDMLQKKTTDIAGFIGRRISSMTIRRKIVGNIHVDGTPVPAGKEIQIKVIPGSLKVVVKV